jgi:predicted outer membrane repeat protein
MLCVNSSASLTDVVFFRNAAQGSGGGMACLFSSPALSGCVFRRNSSVFGGALYCGASHPSVTSCTFVENEGAQGSSIYCRDGSAPAIRHTIIAYGSPGEALYCDGSVPYTALSCIYANGELNELCGDSTSILYVDPLFCDLESGDLTLAGDSECLPENNSWGILIGALGQGCAASANVRRPLYQASSF